MSRISFALIGALAVVWATTAVEPAAAQTNYKPNLRPGPSNYVSPYPGKRWVGSTSGSTQTFSSSGRGQVVTTPNSIHLRYNTPSYNPSYSNPNGYPSSNNYNSGAVSPLSSAYGTPENPIRIHGRD